MMKITARYNKHVVSALVLSIILVVYLLIPSKTFALVLTPAEINFDNSFVQEDRAYSVPKSILIAPIIKGDEGVNMSDQNWYKGLYYYLVANDNHPGFTDIPFHYIVSSSGKAYLGNTGGQERKINITGIGTDMIVIAYLAEPNDHGISVRAQESMAELIADIAGLNNISLDKVKIQGVKFVKNSTEQNVSLEKNQIFGLWNQTLSEVIAKARPLYKPQKKNYQIEVQEISLPTEKVDSGSAVNGSLSIKNKGKFGIYYDTLTEIIASKKDTKQSQFYLNGKWLSISQFGLMKEGDVLLPGEELKFEFTLATPLMFGSLSETFEIKNTGGQRLANTNFTLKLDIKRPKGTIVEITPTSLGYLRVRSTPNGLADNEIGRVSPGQRFFQTDANSSGWVQIKLNDGRKGWVSRQYIKYI